MHRAEQLLQKQSGHDWQFRPMLRQEFDTMEQYPDLYEMVYDEVAGGVWFRQKSQSPVSQKRPSYLAKNIYTPSQTRFGDFADGVADICHGLRKLDQASDGSLGDTIFKILF